VEKGLRTIETAINHVKRFTDVVSICFGECTFGRLIIAIMSKWNVGRDLNDSMFSHFQNQSNITLRLDGEKSLGHSLADFARALAGQPLGKEFREHIRDFGGDASLYMDSARAEALITTAQNRVLLGVIEPVSQNLARAAMGTHYLDTWIQCNASSLTGR
jgi:hypothetical protein